MSVPLNPDRQGESRRGRERVWVNEKQLRSHNTGKKTPVTGHSLTVRSPNLNHVGLGSGSVGMYRVRPVKRHRWEPGHRDTRLHGSHGQTSQHVTSIPHNQQPRVEKHDCYTVRLSCNVVYPAFLHSIRELQYLHNVLLEFESE